ncbi:hypothetical protein COOONC_13257 [Cooperia oncophora]
MYKWQHFVIRPFTTPVYTGFHRATHKRVAIKVETNAASIPLLRNEAACLHFLNSRYNAYGEEPREPILRYMTYGKTEKLKYLVSYLRISME